MPTNWDSVEVQCPFYISSANRAVSCEGPLPGTTASLRFQRTAQFQQCFEAFCCGDYDLCPQAQAAGEKYRMSAGG